ncbi:hypothetical protein IE077_003512 [Cardiosporidium cionae]|uniref:Tubulin/FtsZ GTPase domain-containing protein n=1 Tax=Cardiosporidium cionae TaxID=476202 RepID=A0ABQ7JEX0_9APIC|nr:hypothetical protein IE077_003512 [Cardiosporidium cionae]|eukprot:KAF8822552.1 hypothetical protein IE077_003512 [Cardiosporidium cionae]
MTGSQGSFHRSRPNYARRTAAEYNKNGGQGDAANLYSRGYYYSRKTILLPLLEEIRKLAEKCDSLQGFAISSAKNGGTGSGLGALIHEELSSEYGQLSRLSTALWPAPKESAVVVGLYNAILSTKYFTDEDILILQDNEALHEICSRSFGKAADIHDTNECIGQAKGPQCAEISSPAFSYVFQAFSTLTSAMRFGRTKDFNLENIRKHFNSTFLHQLLTCSCIPPLLQLPSLPNAPLFIRNCTLQLLEPHRYFLKCKMENASTDTAFLLYRGTFDFGKINSALQAVRSHCSGLGNLEYTAVAAMENYPNTISKSLKRYNAQSALYLFNSSAISKNLLSTVAKFDKLYAKRAFVHWFISEGMEESEFLESRERLLCWLSGQRPT